VLVDNAIPAPATTGAGRRQEQASR
jgi:hypothetical protein